MIKKTKGITLIALVITIVVMLMVVSIGIATITDNRNTVETAQTIKKNKIYQDYKTALEMDISNKQIQDATQAVDENFLNDLMVNIKNDEKFKDCSEEDIKLVEYDNSSNTVNEYYYENTNAIYIKTKEGYKFIIDIKLEIHDVTANNNSEPGEPEPGEPEPEEPEPEQPEQQQHTHSYQYYDSSGIAKGTTHPTAVDTYTYKCACGDGAVTHTISNLSKPVKKDTSKHYLRQCTSRAHSTTYYVGEQAHSYQYYNSSGRAKGTSHPTGEGTYTYKCACGYGAVTHTVSGVSKINGDNEKHNKYKCTCGISKTEAHDNVWVVYAAVNNSHQYLSIGWDVNNHPNIDPFGSTYKIGSTNYSVTSNTLYKKCKTCDYISTTKHTLTAYKTSKVGETQHSRYKCSCTNKAYGFETCKCNCGQSAGYASFYSGRCDTRTDHKHTCSICGRAGTNTDTKHKESRIDRTWHNTNNHYYRTYCSCGYKITDTTHPLTFYSAGRVRKNIQLFKMWIFNDCFFVKIYL